MDLSIIIVNWNSVGHLRKCLASIYADAPNLAFEVVVVDSASFDGSAEMMASEFPQGRFIQSKENIGFASSNNLGFAASTGRVILLLNPDTEVKPDAIATLWKRFHQLPNAGVVGVKLLNTDGTVQTSCIQRFPTVLNQALDAEVLRNALPSLKIWGIWPLLEKQAAPVPVEVISGACMMLARRVFEQVGLFTTDYFMYAEDLDLCFKCQEAGMVNYYTDDAVVVHHGGVSTDASGQSNFSAVTMRKSVLKFFALRYGPVSAFGYRASVVVIAAARCALLMFGGSPSARSRWTAIFRWAMGLDSAESVAPPKAQAAVTASRQ